MVKRDDSGKLDHAGLEFSLSGQGLVAEFYAHLYQNNGTILSADKTKAAFNSKAGVEALQHMIDLIHKDRVLDVGFGAGLEWERHPFVVGRSGMTTTPIGGKAWVERESDFEVGVSMALKHKSIGGYGWAHTYAIPLGAKNPDAAWEWIKYLITPKPMLKGVILRGQPGTRRAAMEDPELFSEDPEWEIIAKSMPYITAVPHAHVSAELDNVLLTELEKATRNMKSAKQALDDAAQKVDAEILQ
jgi:multiple sugar transport system substrate-binding protein